MHIPVMKNEVIEYLSPKANENFIDCTFGQGGHTKAILEKNGPNGKVLAIEADPELYKKFQNQESSFINNQLLERLVLVNDSYSNLREIVKENNFGPIHGILMDLGMSSWHLKESGKGFTFQKDEPLDMRYNPEANSLTACEIINSFSEDELCAVLKEYGEERFAREIAKKIIEKRKDKPIRTTLDLVEVIWLAMPRWYKSGKIHPATKTFQALRIKVNEEIQGLKQGLIKAVDVLEKHGRIVVISFHSLEDREIKQFFKRGAQINILEVLTKKPIIASEEEVKNNPRARSAKLRAVKKIV
ncbi:16S rRNA (cytosine(1402)-N(4))-methyltransferase RsmH [Patescibacteria group bacterium]|nr:16S rRNA (cytosine(1402)-N(4))-methyltransferase RsmH [Patescibacteria group bacterium]MBU4023036.1 16S rRNA (cytosine(1402)-N(4))-methyltransferase RsmH [Patescibacteria group bacterium]